jgi:hypothetical protein
VAAVGVLPKTPAVASKPTPVALMREVQNLEKPPLEMVVYRFDIDAFSTH